MRKSLTEQVKAAKHAYIIHLATSRTGMRRRYSVYVDGNSYGPDYGELDVLWPLNTGEDKDTRKREPLLHGMVYSKDRKYPAFHFCFDGCGFSAMNEIHSTLQAINPGIRVMFINGHSPSASL